MDDLADATTLLTKLHRGCLVRLARAGGVHVQGLQQGGRRLRSILGGKLCNKLADIDVAYAYSRHVTAESVAEFLMELDLKLARTTCAPSSTLAPFRAKTFAQFDEYHKPCASQVSNPEHPVEHSAFFYDQPFVQSEVLHADCSNLSLSAQYTQNATIFSANPSLSALDTPTASTISADLSLGAPDMQTASVLSAVLSVGALDTQTASDIFVDLPVSAPDTQTASIISADLSVSAPDDTDCHLTPF